MNVKERAAYAWGRIVDLFRPKKPEIEVEIEEVTEEFTDEIPEQISHAPEGFADENQSAVVPERVEGEEAVPSRMTDEYKAWLAEQLEADDSLDRNDCGNE